MKHSEEETVLLRALAEFRYQLRCFTLFSEQAAQSVELQPQQHQLLLQIAGSEDEFPVTVSYAAERLGLCHNSMVELVNRCAKQDLLTRIPDPIDGRRVILRITPKGRRLLLSLSEHHARELDEFGPQLIRALNRVRRSKRPAGVKRAPLARGAGA